MTLLKKVLSISAAVPIAAVLFSGASARAQVAPDSKKAMPISDREQAGLRGPVKSCTEEWKFAAGGEAEPNMATTTVYDRAGRKLSTTSESGKSQWVTKYSYAADGRLLKITSGKTDGPQAQITYSYDSSGRLLRIVTEGKTGGEDPSPLDAQFLYDEQGRKSSVQIAPPKKKNVAISMENDGSDRNFQAAAMAICDAVETCASVKTTYNENDRPSAAELRDGEDRVIMRLIRSFDAKGNVIAEHEENQNPELMVPPEMQNELKDQLNAAQRKTIGQLFAGFMASTSSYSYDGEGRLTERRTISPVMEETKSVKYNEQGDRVEEHLSRTGGSFTGGGISDQGVFFPDPRPASGGMPPEQSDTRYSYRYDQFGNWTEQAIETRSAPNEPFRPGRTVTRKLTYYDSADDSQH